MPFSAYTVASMAIPTIAFTTYLYKMYRSIAPKPTMVIKETTQPCDLNAGERKYQIILENTPKTYVHTSHPTNACMMLHEIQLAAIPNHYGFLEEPPSTIHVGNITTPLEQNLYEACKVCDPSTLIRYQDNILGDFEFRYPWTAAKFE